MSGGHDVDGGQKAKSVVLSAASALALHDAASSVDAPRVALVPGRPRLVLDGAVDLHSSALPALAVDPGRGVADRGAERLPADVVNRLRVDLDGAGEVLEVGGHRLSLRCGAERRLMSGGVEIEDQPVVDRIAVLAPANPVGVDDAAASGFIVGVSRGHIDYRLVFHHKLS